MLDKVAHQWDLELLYDYKFLYKIAIWKQVVDLLFHLRFVHKEYLHQLCKNHHSVQHLDMLFRSYLMQIAVQEMSVILDELQG
jgi:hypothetical protein